MKKGDFLPWKILGILVLIVLGCSVLVSAGQIPDMKGSWDEVSYEQYSDATGYENASSSDDSFVLTAQEGRAFAGEESYPGSSDGEIVTESIAGVLSADGTRFWQDHDGTGLSFGEMVSDHEFYNYILLPDDGPLVIVSRMVKNGTRSSSEIGEPYSLVGTWNTTRQRRNGDVNNTGVFIIEAQQGRIWNGTLEIPEEDGTIREMKVIGMVGSEGNLYALTDTGAFYVGNITGEHSMHYVILHPRDTDGTFVADRWWTNNGTTIEIPPMQLPDISGDWNITHRTVIQNGTITDAGALTDEWMTYSNLSDPFFSSVRHSQEPGMPPNLEVSGIFRETDEAFLAGTAPTVVIYHFPDEKTIEAIIMRNLNNPVIFFDTLVQKPA